MEVQHNVELKNKTTFHIGGIARNFYIPKSEDELITLINKIKDEKFYILSGGSNLLINDKKIFEHIIYMKDIDKSIDQINNNKFYIGCSQRIQRVINEINKYGYGGIEELYSLPAMFGGIIYMNAGIGGKKKQLFTISEFIKKVKVLNIKKCSIEWIDKNECKFGHRKSIFQNNEYIILGAECEFYEQKIKKSKERINARIQLCHQKQEIGHGAFGTCFSTSNAKLLKITSLLKHKKGKIRFSKNNSNWLVNEGNGTYKDTIYLISMCKKIHKLFHKDIECEVRIWD